MTTTSSARRATPWAALALVLASVLSISVATGDDSSTTGSSELVAMAQRGELLYDRFCLPCHGTQGDGLGPAAPLVWPQPRDFRSGDYKWRTTSSGKPPTDEDLQRTIRYGVPGTSMHGFDATLGDTDIDLLIQKLKAFAPRKFKRPAVPLTGPLLQQDTTTHQGKALFTEFGCQKCHGDEGKGDGPSAAGLKDGHGRSAAPYDLRSVPLRRPQAKGDDPVLQIYLSLLTGLSGTPMPAYEGAVKEAELWAVATYVQSIRAPATQETWNKSANIPAQARAMDRNEKIMRGGYYPGHGDIGESLIFGQAIMPQGQPEEALTPAQASLDAKRCARCHKQQYREWSSSLHAKAGSPGLIANLLGKERRGSWAALESCQRCHNPLSEQSPMLSASQRNLPAAEGYKANPNYDTALRDQGLNCASCHVRKWQRYGPPLVAGKRLSLPNYPLTELALYERSDFCMPCHQLPSRQNVEGSPLLNTYKEWLEGPYMRRGVQCQHCHMPDREHTWKGVHDPDTFRQGVHLSHIAARSETGTVSVLVKVKNSGAGHYLPTTPTPAAWVSIQLLDAKGKSIQGAYKEQRIGRHLVYQRGWKQLEDSRIPPGESLEVRGAWKQGRVDQASQVRVTLRVEPDEYYERLYERRLKNKSLPKKERQLYDQALAQTRRSHYTALTRVIPIASIKEPTGISTSRDK